MSQANPNWQEWVQIDRGSAEPFFAQIKEALRKWISHGLRDGSLSPGDRVPSERELSDHLNVSQITVKRALNELQREGTLQRIQGRGTFITRPRKLILGLERFYSLTTVALERGMDPVRRSLELSQVAATENVASQLQVDYGQPVAKIVRLRLVDDVPLAVDTSYLPLHLFPDILNDDLERNALYDLMTNKYDVEPIRAREYLEPTLINPFESDILGVSVGAPAMLLARIAYGPNDVPLEYNKSVMRGDMCRFYIDMLKDNL